MRRGRTIPLSKSSLNVSISDIQIPIFSDDKLVPFANFPMDAEKDIAAATFPLVCPENSQLKNKKKTRALKLNFGFYGGNAALQRVVPVSSTSMVSSNNELEVAKCSNPHMKSERHGFFHALKTMMFKMLMVKKFQQRRPGKILAERSAITSGHTQQLDHENAPKRKGRPKLSHILKAALYETTLARKIRARKAAKRCGSDGSFLGSSTGDSSSLSNSSSFTSSTLSSTITSSSMSRSTSNSRSLSDRIKSIRSISSTNIKTNLRNLSDKFKSNSKSLSRNKTSVDVVNSNGLKEEQHGLKEEQHVHFADEETQNEEKGMKNKEVWWYRSAMSLCCLLILSMLGLLILYCKLRGILV